MAFTIRRGVNLGGWISQSRLTPEQQNTYIGAENIEHIARSGFDHIRLPVDEVQLWDDDGERIGHTWKLLDRCIDQSLDRGLRVVVDLHILRSHYFNAPERPLFTDPHAPERFARIWRELSAHLRSRPLDMVAYELMNEPVADEPEDWNRVYPAPYRAIRDSEPDRTIVLGGNRWSNVMEIDTLRIPDDDANMIITFHYYNPMYLTHYRASFVKACAAYEGPVRYPGRPIATELWEGLPPEVREGTEDWNGYYDASVMERELAKPLAIRTRTGLPLYCGEFGVIGNVPPDLRRAWARDLGTVLESHDIAWAAWSYKSRSATGFCLFDAALDPTPVYEGLMKR